jgi:hypothetical protein
MSEKYPLLWDEDRELDGVLDNAPARLVEAEAYDATI